MNNYSNFPPFNCFKRVLTNSPQSALIYASIWENKKKSSRLSFQRNEVKSRFFISPTLFRNHLLSLGRLELITFEETPESFLIEFYENEKS